jgi:hypothetical protein
MDSDDKLYSIISVSICVFLIVLCVSVKSRAQNENELKKIAVAAGCDIQDFSGRVQYKCYKDLSK